MGRHSDGRHCRQRQCFAGATCAAPTIVTARSSLTCRDLPLSSHGPHEGMATCRYTPNRRSRPQLSTRTAKDDTGERKRWGMRDEGTVNTGVSGGATSLGQPVSAGFQS